MPKRKATPSCSPSRCSHHKRRRTRLTDATADHAEIQRLLDTRNQIIALATHENELYDRLAAKDKELVPTTDMDPDEIATRTRLRMLRDELSEERRKRVLCEAKLDIVEKKHIPPFEISFLLDAFKRISRCTTVVTEE